MSQSTVDLGARKRGNTTAGDRCNSSLAPTSLRGISPIIASAEFRKNVLFTEPRGGSKQLSGIGEKSSRDCALESTVGTSSSKSIFPYPETAFIECDPGEMLCSALKIMNVHKKMEAEVLRLRGPKKRKDKAETEAHFEFFKDTFSTVNSEAANHALHLIFSTFDPQETEKRFRDCWPIHEKSLEKVFRSVTLDWIKQLVETHPSIFHDVRVETIAGLLVHPGGERYISFLRPLCRLALFSLASRKKGLIKQQVLLPPAPCSDPEIMNRQMHVLETRARRNGERVPEMYKQLIKKEMRFSLRLRTLEENLQYLQQVDTMQSARLRSLLNSYPDSFGNPTEDELQERDAVISSLKLRDIMANGYHDTLRTRLEVVLKNKYEEINKPVSVLQNVMEKFGTVWHVLEMGKSVSPVLNCNKFLGNLLQNNSETPSLGSFIKTLTNLAGNLFSNGYLSEETPTALLEEFKAVSCHARFLGVMEEEMNRSVYNDSDVIRKAEMKRDELKLRMNDFNWNQLSQVYENEDGTSLLSDIFPVRVYDINRTSGLTPRLHKFLDSSLSSSSDEHQQETPTPVVRQRNVDVSKAKMRTTNPQSSQRESKNNNNYTTDENCNKSTDSIRSSAKIEATPLSSTNIELCSKKLHNPSLFRDSITGTPISEASTSSTTPGASRSSEMGKSLSFSATPTRRRSESAFFFSTPHYQPKNIRHPSGDNCSFNGEDFSMLESSQSFGTGRKETLSNFSFSSSSGTPIKLDPSTRNRLDKLMESIAPKDHSSRSSDAGLFTMINYSNESLKNNDIFGQSKIKKCTSKESCSLIHFSIAEDLEDVKGIMDTSLVDVLLDSDSD